MRFSNEAMRDILMFIEEDQEYYDDKCGDKLMDKYTIPLITNNEYFFPLFEKHKYSKDELTYTIGKMIEGNLLTYIGSRESFLQITGISFYGIQLLDSIRPQSTWEKVKDVANKVGNHTIKFIEETAHDVAVESAKQAVTIAMTQK